VSPTELEQTLHKITVEQRVAGRNVVVQEVGIDFTRLFYMLYLSLDTQVLIADTKAQIIMGANAILLAAAAFNRGEALRVFTNSSATLSDQVGLVLTLLMLLALFVSVYYALITARPNLIPPPGANRNLFFFGHIAQMDEEAYVDAFLGMSMDDVKRTVIRQIYARSVVVERKYRNVRVSLTFLFLGLVCFVAARIILSVAA
jgi:hypothetical protein